MSSELGKFLKYKRGDKSLRDFAAYLEISHAYLDSLEKGIDPKTKKEINISTDLLQRLSKKLNVSVEAILNMMNGENFKDAIHNSEINNYENNEYIPYEYDKEFLKVLEEDEKKEQDLIRTEKGIDLHQDELELLFDKHKDILTESDKAVIKTIIEERKKEIDKELGEG